MTMPDQDSPDASVRVYVNERGISVPSGSNALDAVAIFSPTHAEELSAGAARLTDSRGLPIDAAVPVHGGMILRLLPVRTPVTE